MMNISIVIFSLGGGAGRVAINIANELHLLGHNVKVVYGTSKNGMEKELQVPFIHLQANRLIPFSQKIIFQRKIFSNNIILIFEPILGAFITLPLKFSKSKPHVVWRILTDPIQSLNSNRSYFQRLFKKYFLRVSAGLTDHVIGNSQGSTASFRAICPRYPKHKISLIYNPVIGLSNKPSNSEASLRDELYLSLECRLIAAAGRLTRQKGFDVLLKAYARVEFEFPWPTHLVIFGEGSERKSLEDLAGSLGLTEKVTFYGHSSNLENYLTQADLFVLSSRYEGFGNVLVEALAVNAPVVSTDCLSGPTEILDKGKYGVLVPPEDPEALAQGISRMLKDGKNAFPPGAERAKDFSISTIVKQYEKVLADLSSE